MKPTLFAQQKIIMLVTQKQELSIDTYLKFIESAIKAGVNCVQLREKKLSTQARYEFAVALKKQLDIYQIPLIINDDMQLCHQIQASGVHLGQTDGDVLLARKLLGPTAIIGQTVDTIEQIQYANSLPLDYIGIGAIFPTTNKSNIAKLWGINGLTEAVSLSNHPVIAIGGIDENNSNSLNSCGIKGIAAIKAFHDSKHLTKTINQLTEPHTEPRA